MTRATFEARVTWNAEGGDGQEKTRLLSLLREERASSVPPDDKSTAFREG